MIKFIDNRFGGNEEVTAELGEYHSNRNPALTLYTSAMERWATASVNVEGFKVPEGCILLKTWSENTGLDQLLLEAGVIEAPVLQSVRAGYADALLYRLTERMKNK